MGNSKADFALREAHFEQLLGFGPRCRPLLLDGTLRALVKHRVVQLGELAYAFGTEWRVGAEEGIRRQHRKHTVEPLREVFVVLVCNCQVEFDTLLQKVLDHWLDQLAHQGQAQLEDGDIGREFVGLQIVLDFAVLQEGSRD